MLNRSQAPALQKIVQLPIPVPQRQQLQNGVPVYYFPTESPEVVMIKLLFKAGRWQEPKRLVAALTARMLREGTAQYTAQQLANKVEYYGATLKTRSSKEMTSVTLHSLTKHLPHLLPILQDVLTQTTFPQHELDTILRNSQQKLLISQSKIEYIADKALMSHLFGATHPYGYFSTAEDYAQIQTQDLKEFYQQYYTADNCSLYIAGKLFEQDEALIKKILENDNWSLHAKHTPKTHPPHAYTPESIYISKPDALQAAIRIARPIANKTHPDYHGLFVLNAILGGYFGARLMSNLREDKNYTYGIYSAIYSMLHGGYWLISTEVGTDVQEAAVKEIFLEIRRLREELVSVEEMNMVRNYLLGSILSNIDGAFNLAATLQAVYAYDLDHHFLYQLLDTIKHISPQQIRALAQQYLDPADLTTVIVGK